jgi:hypothetical protein
MCLLSAKERAVVAALLAGRQHANERARMRAECDCCLCTRHARTLTIHTRREANIQSGTQCTGKARAHKGAQATAVWGAY